MEFGDYICVEDINLLVLNQFGQGFIKEFGYILFGYLKFDKLKEFMKIYLERYFVD